MPIMNLPEMTLSPFEIGRVDGLAGKPGPAFSTPDSSWSARLYNRGWESGAQERLAATKQ